MELDKTKLPIFIETLAEGNRSIILLSGITDLPVSFIRFINKFQDDLRTLSYRSGGKFLFRFRELCL